MFTFGREHVLSGQNLYDEIVIGELRVMRNKIHDMRLSPIRTFHYFSLLKYIEFGDLLFILGEEDTWYKTMSHHGIMYAKKEDLLEDTRSCKTS